MGARTRFSGPLETEEPVKSLTKPIEEDNIPLEDPEDEDAESSEDEEEDEEGDLITEKIDDGINLVLNAIRSNSEKLKDKNFQFFPEVGAEGTAEAQERKKSEKPVYLKDYQREQLLKLGEDAKDSNQEAAPETYAEEQARVRKDLISQFHDNDDDDDDLLRKRTEEREIPEIELPDPEKDASGFLDAFISQKAWVPKKDEAVPTYNDVVEDGEDDDEEFDDLSEKFESAYNFRYEDPNAAEIVSYARDQNTLRRGKLSSRQKKREKERAEREKQKEQEKLELSKLRKKKVNEVTDKLAQLQEALGEDEESVAKLLSMENLDDDFDSAEWDKRMQKLFDEEFYSRGDSADKDALAAATNDYEEDVGETFDPQESSAATDYDNTTNNYMAEDNMEEPPQKLSRKELKRKAEKFVEANEDLLAEEVIKPAATFRYRQVEPETFGLTTRDILLASDKDLNQFVGLKKLASFRDRAKIENDRKRYSKKKRLRQWRKEVFGSEDVPSDELWEKYKREEAKKLEAEEGQKPKHKKKKQKRA